MAIFIGDWRNNHFGGSSGRDLAIGNGGDDTLNGADGDDTLIGGEGDDYLDGGTGSDWMIGGSGNDTYVVDLPDDKIIEWKGGGTDTVQSSMTWSLGAGSHLENLALTGSSAINGTGNELANLLTGNSAANILGGGLENDTLDGGPGDDTLLGEGGDDEFRFAGRFGHDVIVDDASANGDTLFFSDLGRADLNLTRTGLDLVLSAGNNSVTVLNWFGNAASRIGRVEFAADQAWFESDILQLTNVAPAAGAPLDNQSAREGEAFEYLLPVGAFVDPDSEIGDSLTYHATLSDGTPLPAWLSFDPQVLSFSGTPDASGVGEITVAVTAVDQMGASATGTFMVTVADAGPVGEVEAIGEFRVNTKTTEHQGFASVAVLNDGGFVVAYEAHHSGQPDHIFAQRYDRYGAKSGPEFQVDTNTSPSKYEPAVAATSDGGFAIAWLSSSGDRSISHQRFDVYGHTVGDTQTAAISGNGSFFSDVALTALNDGRSAVAWGDSGTDNEGRSGASYVCIFDAAGKPEGGPIQLIEPSINGSYYEPNIGVINGSDGAPSGFVATSLHDGGGWLQRFNLAGEKVGDPVEAGGRGSPSVTALATGAILLSWASGGDVWVQEIDADGLPQQALKVNSAVYNSCYRPDISALPDGGFVVAWTGQVGNPSFDVFARHYDAEGNPRSNEFLVNSFTPDIQGRVSVANFADGGFVITWHSRYQDGDSYGVYGQRYAADGSPIGETPVLRGSAGDDWQDASDWSEKVIALGMGGNDSLIGSPFDDVIAGDEDYEGGADTLNGGAGDDVLIGGEGLASDTYVFSSGYGDDVIINHGGSGTIHFPDLSAADVSPTRAGRDLLLTAGDDSVTVRRWFWGEDVNEIRFNDGASGWTPDDIRSATNQAPVVNQPLPDLSAVEGEYFGFTLPEGAFADPDADIGDSLSYTATLVDGAPLPSWLIFDPWSHAFGGSPEMGTAGTAVAVAVIVVDEVGATAVSDFTLTVEAAGGLGVVGIADLPLDSLP